METFTIHKLERLNNSVNGNPRYEVYYSDDAGTAWTVN